MAQTGKKRTVFVASDNMVYTSKNPDLGKRILTRAPSPHSATPNYENRSFLPKSRERAVQLSLESPLPSSHRLRWYFFKDQPVAYSRRCTAENRRPLICRRRPRCLLACSATWRISPGLESCRVVTVNTLKPSASSAIRFVASRATCDGVRCSEFESYSMASLLSR